MPSSSRARRIATTLLLLLTPVMNGAIGPRTNFDSRILAAHNRERSDAGLSLMRWNGDLAKSAGDWADFLARTGRFEHSPDDPDEPIQGENLWAGTAGYYQPESMVGLWIAEKKHFKRGSFPYNSRSGRVEDVSHYTQLMWRRSREVGCALRRGRDEDFLVCRYKQAGNIIGEMPF